MEQPNKDANQEKPCSHSPLFLKNRGRIAFLPPAERVAMARKGGLVKSERKKQMSQINPVRTGKATSIISIGQCNDCPSKSDCREYKADSACVIELNIRRNLIGQFKAFVGERPEDLLIEMMKLHQKLEKEIDKNPTYYNLTQQIYLLIRIYQLKFGEKSFDVLIKAGTGGGGT